MVLDFPNLRKNRKNPQPPIIDSHRPDSMGVGAVGLIRRSVPPLVTWQPHTVIVLESAVQRCPLKYESACPSTQHYGGGLAGRESGSRPKPAKTQELFVLEVQRESHARLTSCFFTWNMVKKLIVQVISIRVPSPHDVVSQRAVLSSLRGFKLH